ncbi:sensor domain-containing diguanylate cyclase [Alteromonas sp. CYL-A6]|uniref:sensor domain-containing diguanylate cyclase n=1 Tax=Alteromonas nitratireducens TaxID=3390813 RepID=UPI0034B0432D
MNGKNVVFTLIVAAVYIVTARISQVFAIEPGNVTPVWIPSGLMLALALYYGRRTWPGIFLGAFFGNVWAYFSFHSLTLVSAAVAAGMINGLGDVIALVVMAGLIQRLTSSESPFHSLHHFLIFGGLGVVLGPLISAVFGISGLALFSFLPAEQYWVALINWWVGDGVGVILFTPLLYAWLKKPEYPSPWFMPVMLLSTLVFAGLTLILFDLVMLPQWAVILCVMLLPVAFALLLQEGQRAVYFVQIVIAAIAVFATYSGQGPFIDNSYLPPLIALQLFIGAFSCVIFSITLMLHQRRLLAIQLQLQQKKLESLYRHDPLTGLWNRYRIEEFLDMELTRFHRQGGVFAVLVLDIDDFKQINDCRGHLEGDRILVEFARAIDAHIRDIDLFGRWGGEEFVIIATDQTPESAAQLAEKVVRLIASHDFSLDKPLTVSLGYTLSVNGDNKDALLGRADEALYQAKQQGKNQAVAAVKDATVRVLSR